MNKIEGIVWMIALVLGILASIKTYRDWKNEIRIRPVTIEYKLIALISNFIHDLVVFLFPFLVFVLIFSSIFSNSPPSVKIIIGVNLFITLYYLQFAIFEMCSLTWIYNTVLGFPMDKPYRNVLRNNQSKMDRDYQSLNGTHYQNTLEWVNGNIVTFSLVAILNLVYLLRP
jgi:hypothetical protein